MAKPNYSFEKRQREMAKRKKKEDKLREKAGRKVDSETGEAGSDNQSGAEPQNTTGPAGSGTPV